MNIFDDIKIQITGALKELTREGRLPEISDFSRMVVEPPRDASFGDAATNAALVLCGQASLKPRDFAAVLAGKLKSLAFVSDVSVAGPGFVNLKLADAFWHERLREILNKGTAFGDSDMGKGEKINVEFVSANPTGPMHVGHARGAVFGDALARLLKKAGYDVTREYYVNDAGTQVDVLARSAYLRYKQALGHDIGTIPEGLYPGDYLISVGEALALQAGTAFVDKPESEWLTIFRRFAVNAMLELIRDDLAALGVKFDVFSSERALIEKGKVQAVWDFLKDRDLIYEGVLDAPKEKKHTDDWEPRPQMLFRATEFGDDVDRALKKSDGTYTYFASDMAYHKDKFDRGFKHMIDVWGADHGGYVKRIKAALGALTDKQADLDVKLCQMVNLTENGEPVKMSKRAGTFVTMRDVIDAVGKDVMRFIMLTRKNDAHLDFDLAKVKEESKDNPVFYVNYAYARASSVFRHAAEIFNDAPQRDGDLAQADLTLLSDEDETALIRLLAAFPRQVEIAASVGEPHRIAYYLNDVASAFHALWNKGRQDVQMRFLDEKNPALSMARLALVRGVAVVIEAGLEIFGVCPPREM